MKEILERYFDYSHIRYFHPADIIADEHYIRYEWKGERIILTVGCNEGEIPLFVCHTPEDLETKIKTIIS